MSVRPMVIVGMRSERQVRHGPADERFVGFTLIELLVVIAVITILAGLLVPALARSKSRAQTIGCVNNLRQLHLGWLMYAQDHQDLIPLNGTSAAGGKHHEEPNWAAGVMSFEDRTAWSDNLRDNTNTWNLLSAYGGIGPYVRAASLFHCPSDRSYVTISNQRHDRVRSYSVNWHVGHWGTYVDGVDIPQSGLYPFWTYHNLAKIVRPSPADLFVFIDTSEDSIDARTFIIGANAVGPKGVWGQMPAWRHDRMGTLSFADGHVEKKQWRDPRTLMPSQRKWTYNISQPNNADIDWLASHATAPADK